MKKSGSLLALLMILMLTGCGEIRKAQETTVTVEESGKIIQVLVEEFQDESYSEQELKDSIKDLVEDYQEQTGSPGVTLDQCNVKNGTARVILEYESQEDYREFNLVDFFAGTVEEARNQGYLFTCSFQDAQGEAAGDILQECAERRVLIVREPVCVMAPGEILYVSANMEVLDENRARLVSDTGIEEESAQTATDAYGYVIYQ